MEDIVWGPDVLLHPIWAERVSPLLRVYPPCLGQDEASRLEPPLWKAWGCPPAPDSSTGWSRMSRRQELPSLILGPSG